MAKRSSQNALDSMFKRTEGKPKPPPTAPAQPVSTQDTDDLDEGKFKSVGVGLREGEHAALETIAEETRLTRNALLRWAARDFIRRYRAGEIVFQYEERVTTHLKMPAGE